MEEEDLPYEEEILRNPYSVKHWLRYIEHKRGSPNHVINMLYERALKELPGSYKLWYAYLRLRRRQVRARCITDPSYEHANNAHERALVFMNKMPRIWMDYCTFLMEQGLVTRTRRTFDRALRALPVTQHTRIWPMYLKFVRAQAPEETAVRVYRRYMQVAPECAEEFIQFLISAGELDAAALKLAEIINDENFSSKEGKSKHQLWNELCELLSHNPDKVHSLAVEPIIRQGIHKYRDQIGMLWCSLADYYIRAGNFERARDVYEEAVQTVMTVRDFTQVFDAYAQFEESVISSKMESEASATDEDDLDLELRLARLEDIMERRPLLLNSVLLRQNPHNVHEWHKRVDLYKGKPNEKLNVVNTYTEAVQMVDAKLALGKPHTLWVAFAKYYEDNKQVKDAHTIFERAVEVAYKSVDDLAAVWCEWTEFFIRHEQYAGALKLLQKAVIPPGRPVDFFDQNETVQDRVHKSLKLWSLYADLEESFGTFKSCKAVYDRIIDLRIATPQIIINYGMFLEENKYFEEAFKAYEKGIALFKWPNVFDIWNTYLTKFIQRYGGKKIERARDLFEQCLDGCPEKFAKNLFLLYAKLEEEHGLARHAMRIYDRATTAVPVEQQHEMFNIYIKRAAELYGVTYTREIYQKAIDTLHEDKAREMCMRFADLERKLGEVDRARAIYVHASEICDPRSAPEFWTTWKEFEVAHGNEDTVREMLRNKRKVQAIFNTQVNFMASKTRTASTEVTESEPNEAAAAGDEVDLETRARELAEETVAAKQPDKSILFVRSSGPSDEHGGNEVKASNPEEIDIDQFSSDEDEQTTDNVEKQHVPSAVFGSLKKNDDDDDSD